MHRATKAHWFGEWMAATVLKLWVEHDHLKFHWFKCGNKQGKNGLPSTSKVAGGSGIQISGRFDVRRLIQLGTPGLTSFHCAVAEIRSYLIPQKTRLSEWCSSWDEFAKASALKRVKQTPACFRYQKLSSVCASLIGQALGSWLSDTKVMGFYPPTTGQIPSLTALCWCSLLLDKWFTLLFH